MQVAWVKLVGALYLLYLAWSTSSRGGDRTSARRCNRPRPWLGLSAFWATVVKVELTDIVFAVDSILVAVAMSPKMWVIVTGGVLGIITMRLVIGQLLTLVRRYPALVDGAFVIIAWVGLKLLIEYLHADGHDPLPGQQVDLVRADRGDLRGRVCLRPPPGSGADDPDDDATALLNEQ